jgi:hypothetical protein
MVEQRRSGVPVDLDIEVNSASALLSIAEQCPTDLDHLALTAERVAAIVDYVREHLDGNLDEATLQQLERLEQRLEVLLCRDDR